MLESTFIKPVLTSKRTPGNKQLSDPMMNLIYEVTYVTPVLSTHMEEFRWISVLLSNDIWWYALGHYLSFDNKIEFHLNHISNIFSGVTQFNRSFPGLTLSGCNTKSMTWKCHVNTLRPRQNGRHFPDDIFKCMKLNENVWISNKILLKFVPKGPINNIPALVQIMAWRRPGDKPLSEPIYASLGLNELILCHIMFTW